MAEQLYALEKLYEDQEPDLVSDTIPAVLHAYDANLLELYNSNQAANNRDQFGFGNKFITPTIANGKVYIGTPNSVAVFGLLPLK